MAKRVPILILAFDAERWLRDTVESALAQTWQAKEIIIVHDDSTDRTPLVARVFASPDVKVVTQSNAGASAARNHALSPAQGGFIQRLDADDLLAPDKVAPQLRDAETGGTGATLLSSSLGEFVVHPDRATFVPSGLWHDLAPVDFLLANFNA
jgi:glycosyltransferase involved in cell wall biosynthesis